MDPYTHHVTQERKNNLTNHLIHVRLSTHTHTPLLFFDEKKLMSIDPLSLLLASTKSMLTIFREKIHLPVSKKAAMPNAQ